MNYLITLKCPKKCSFCFSKKINQLMSLDEFKKWVDHDMEYLTKNIGLLGGEPVTHPQFGEFLEYALLNSLRVSVFTNLMTTRKSSVDILRIATLNPHLTIIWNNSEFESISEKHRNESLILATKLNAVCAIRYSVTFTPGLDLSYLLDISAKTGIKAIRFAVNVSDMHIIQRPEEMEFLIKQLEILNSNGFEISFDNCGYIPASSLSPMFKLRLSRLNSTFSQCTGAALDVLPDGRVMPCMPYIDEPKDVYIDSVSDMDGLVESLITHYGPQAHMQKAKLCPATYERNKRKVIEIIPG